MKFWETDTAMACMLLLLAAVDAGLGGWLFGVSHGEEDLFREFGVPADRKLIGAIGLGYPGVDENPRGSAFTRRGDHSTRWSPQPLELRGQARSSAANSAKTSA